MKYERLTQRLMGSNTPFTEYATYDEIINRLAELEDKIENGTLVELPCKVGTIVYYVDNYEVNTFFKQRRIWDYTEVPFTLDMLNTYKINWFLTEAEAKAEVKLLELKGVTK